MKHTTIGVGRREMLLGVAGAGAATVLTACTGNTKKSSTPTTPAGAASNANSAPGKTVTIGFSAPAADHGWIAAIARNASTEAKKFSDVKLEAVQPTNDIAAQIAAVETLINKKVDVIVMLPNDGKQLTTVARKAMNAGVQVVNLDRIFDSPLAYRTWIGGDNYGIGVRAG